MNFLLGELTILNNKRYAQFYFVVGIVTFVIYNT